MAELQDQLKRDLAALRERAGPSADVEARVLAAVEAVGFGPDGGPDGGPDFEPDDGPSFEPAANDGGAAGHAAQLVWAGKIVAATLALTTAGLLTVAAAGRSIRARSNGDDAPTVVTPASPRVATTTLDSPPAAPLAEPGPPPSIQAPATQPRPTPSRQVTAAPSPTLDADPLAAELALIEAARTAGSTEAAVEQLREHARRFEHGALATERELLLIERLCELGSLAEARARLDRAFADASPQRVKLIDRCPELGRDGLARGRARHQ